MSATASTVEYKVDSLRETLIGDKIKTDDLERLLNTRAREGWALKRRSAQR